MNILYVPDGGLNGVCPRWRCVTPAKALEKLGHKVEYFKADKQYPDIVVIQRPMWADAAALVRGWRQRGVPVVCDLDDYLFSGAVPPECESTYLGIESFGWHWSLHASFRECSAITVTTPQFLPYLRKYEYDETKEKPRMIAVLPNFWDDLDPQWKAPSVPRRKTKKSIDLAMIGSATHALDLLWIKDALAGLLKNRKDVRIFVTKGNEKRLDGLPRVKVAPFVDWRQYARFLAKFDVILAPLAPSILNDCKSWIRLMEANLAGRPYVASQTGPYISYRQRNPCYTGYMALDRLGTPDPHRWHEALLHAVDGLDSSSHKLIKEATEPFAMSAHTSIYETVYMAVIKEERGW